MKSRLVLSLAVSILTVSSTVHAAVIVDPENIGAIRVFIRNTTFNAVDGGQIIDPLTGQTITTPIRELVVGARTSSASDGALLLNSSTTPPPGQTNITTGRLTIGQDLFATTQPGSSGVPRINGSVIVQGDGTEGSASINLSESLIVGGLGNGVLEIRDGGVVTAPVGYAGLALRGATPFDGGTSQLIIDGGGSRLSVGEFNFGVGQGIDSTVIVSGGGRFSVGIEVQGPFVGNSGVIDLGSGGGNSLLRVTGAGSIVETGEAGLDLTVGAGGGSAVLEILDGGRVIERLPGQGFPQSGPFIEAVDGTSTVRISGRDANGAASLYAVNDNLFVGRAGAVTVENFGELRVNRDIFLSEDLALVGTDLGPGSPAAADAEAILEVSSGASVFAERIRVSEFGRLVGSGGIINADVVVNGGVVSPGLSPGVMTIAGDLEFQSLASVLQIELGASAADSDLLVVLGDLIVGEGFSLDLSFLEPGAFQSGSSFDFLNIGGAIVGELSLVRAIVGGERRDIAFNFQNGTLSGAFVSEVPLPAGGALFLSGLVIVSISRRFRRQRAA